MSTITPATLPVGSTICTLGRHGKILSTTQITGWTPGGKARTSDGALLTPRAWGALSERQYSAYWYPLTPEVQERDSILRRKVEASNRIAAALDEIQKKAGHYYGGIPHASPEALEEVERLLLTALQALGGE